MRTCLRDRRFGATPMRHRRLAIIVAPLAVVCLAAVGLRLAGVPYSYSQTIRSGDAAIPYVAEFNALFPKSDRFISHFTGTNGTPTWNSEAELYGRYVLTMQMQISLNRLHNRITSCSKPTFFLEEVTSVTPRPDGGADVGSGQGLTFGLPEWNHLVRSGGDFNVLGVKLRKNS